MNHQYPVPNICVHLCNLRTQQVAQATQNQFPNFSDLSNKSTILTNNINAYRQWIDQLLAEGKTVNVPVHGMSMFPFLMPGDQVRIRRVGFDEMKPGQVLVFENNGQWIAHRLVQKDIQQKMLITKGDGLPRKDLSVTAGQAKGIIIKVLKTRSPLAWSINTPVDRLMVMVTPVTGWGFWYLGRVVRWLIG